MKSEAVHPKNTFMNLAESKRKRILSAMVQEFALNGYRKASLNSIVSQSKIAKGSLYQYFSSKEEIFLFVFDQFTSLVKRSILAQTENIEGDGLNFWDKAKTVLQAGIQFIDQYPDYFQLYLRVLFEHDVPHREELIARVRLFSNDYFTPLVRVARKEGVLRSDVSVIMVVFSLDAMFDRFLQGYSKTYLDGGLGLAGKNGAQIGNVIDELIGILKDGLSAENRSLSPE